MPACVPQLTPSSPPAFNGEQTIEPPRLNQHTPSHSVAGLAGPSGSQGKPKVASEHPIVIACAAVPRCSSGVRDDEGASPELHAWATNPKTRAANIPRC